MITVSLYKADKDMWIERIDQRIAESEIKTLARFQRYLDDYNNSSWIWRWMVVQKPTLDMAKRQAMNGLSTLRSLKEILQMNGWETVHIEDWVFRWLHG